MVIFSMGNRVCSPIRAELHRSFLMSIWRARGGRLMENKRESHFAQKLSKAKLGFKYVQGYINSDSYMIIECEKCGKRIRRSGGFIRKAIRGEKNISCDQCTGRAKTNKLRISIKRECVYCGGMFLTSSHSQMYCSEECRKKGSNRKRWSRKWAKEISLRNGGLYDASISLNKLLIRDKNKCYICGGECDTDDYVLDKNKNIITGNNYPSIDHILPLSKGGTHTWSNVKLAHRYCNSLKSNSIDYVASKAI